MKVNLLSGGHFALNRVAIAATFAALSALPMSASALGLGKLNVKSALGETLRAEIDITSINPEEAATLQVRVASPETYRAAGVDYNAVLSGANIVLQRRADGRPYLQISSNRVVQEPFVDVILDLGWSAGRLVREYTLLFDPPAMRAAVQPVAPTMTPPVQITPVTPPPVVAQARPEAPAPVASAEAKPKAAAVKTDAPAKQRVKPAEPVEAKSSVTVRRGDTLSSIALRHLPEGISLDQMLVGLYRQNPQAFQGENMNRLRSGAVLTLPDTETVKSVSNSEARQFIVAQSADFSAYRQRLAAAVGVEAPKQSQRQAKGQVQAEVQDRKEAVAPTPDKLTLSKGAVSGAAAAPEDRLAKSRATQEGNTRVAELSKNLDELRKLKDKAVEVAASQPAAAKPSVVVPSVVAPVAPVLAPAVAPAPASAVVVPALTVPDAALAASNAASAVDVAASEVAVAASAASEVLVEPIAPVASATSVPAPVVPVVEEESGFFASLNPLWLAGAGAVVALLAGGAMFLRNRRRADTGETSFLESRLQPDSFFGASGGQRVDTRDATGGPSSMSYSLSQLDAIGDVDPVAEADVYLAYGRDLQAEEILKEALRTAPDRLSVRVKLLEVYAKRRDTKGFESLAIQLHGLTNGAGEDWARAQEMGMGIDPENPLYQPGGQPSTTKSFDSGAHERLGASTVPHSVVPTPAESTQEAFIELDLDGTGRNSVQDGVTDSVSPQIANEPMPELELPEFDALPSGAITPVSQSAASAAATEDAGLDFDLSLGDTPSLADEPVMDLSEAVSPPIQEPARASEPAASLGFDLGDLSLDLDAPAASGASTTGSSLDELPLVDAPLSADPMARKFDLAQEFSQIGDIEGARELLQEVLDQAEDEALQRRAQSMLDSLG